MQHHLTPLQSHPQRTFLLLALCTAFAACEDATEPRAISLADIQQATAQFAQPEAALRAGYFSPPGNPCVAAPPGGMGIHYSNAALMGMNPQAPTNANGRRTGTDGVIDPLKPEILLYEPQAGGGFRLVGVEYMVFEAAWKAAGNTQPPQVLGVDFQYVADNPATPMDEARGAEPHYTLHVWSAVQNPAGLTAPFNPLVKCN